MTHCSALALSGGGANGAWEAGVLWGLMHSDNAQDFNYEVVAGVSAGALNTSVISMFTPEDGVAMSEFLSDTWSNRNTEDVWVQWPGGVQEGSFQQSGLVDCSPLHADLAETLKPFTDYKKKFAITAVDVEAGTYTHFDDKNTQKQDIHSAAVASASTPLLFPPHKFNGRWYTDSGSAWGLNVNMAIKKCLEIVNDPSKITLDALIFDDGDRVLPSGELKVVHFSNDFYDFNTSGFSLVKEIEKYPTVNFRYLFLQTHMVTNELDFSQANTWPMQLQGRLDQSKATNLGPQIGFTYLKQWIQNSNGEQDSFESFAAFYSSLI